MKFSSLVQRIGGDGADAWLIHYAALAARAIAYVAQFARCVAVTGFGVLGEGEIDTMECSLRRDLLGAPN